MLEYLFEKASNEHILRVCSKDQHYWEYMICWASGTKSPSFVIQMCESILFRHVTKSTIMFRYVTEHEPRDVANVCKILSKKRILVEDIVETNDSVKSGWRESFIEQGGSPCNFFNIFAHERALKYQWKMMVPILTKTYLGCIPPLMQIVLEYTMEKIPKF